MDATREELPDTMAAIRLSGMEISDLTMELSDLGSVYFRQALLFMLFQPKNICRLNGNFISSLSSVCNLHRQEITQGVRSSTKAVRLAEERLRRLTNMAPPGYISLFSYHSLLPFLNGSHALNFTLSLLV